MASFFVARLPTSSNLVSFFVDLCVRRKKKISGRRNAGFDVSSSKARLELRTQKTVRFRRIDLSGPREATDPDEFGVRAWSLVLDRSVDPSIARTFTRARDLIFSSFCRPICRPFVQSINVSHADSFGGLIFFKAQMFSVNNIAITTLLPLPSVSSPSPPSSPSGLLVFHSRVNSVRPSSLDFPGVETSSTTSASSPTRASSSSSTTRPGRRS